MTNDERPTTDEYLWDGSGAPDPETARIARLLGGLRTPLPPVPDVTRIARLKLSLIHI